MSEGKDRFEISFGNLQVLRTIPDMMIEPKWRHKLRELVLEYLFEEIKTNCCAKGCNKEFRKWKKQFVKEILDEIEKDISYQKTHLTGDFEKDKPINWRIEGLKRKKKQERSW